MDQNPSKKLELDDDKDSSNSNIKSKRPKTSVDLVSEINIDGSEDVLEKGAKIDKNQASSSESKKNPFENNKAWTSKKMFLLPKCFE